MAGPDPAREFRATASPPEQAALVGVDHEELPALLEALLLVSPEPADLRNLAAAAGVPVWRSRTH